VLPLVSIVIPAFNEAGRLPRYLDEIIAYFESHAEGYEVIVVDDGSQDDTVALVEKVGVGHPAVRVVRLETNQGKGAAVCAGMKRARGEYRLFADADGATPMAEIERLDQALDAGADVAVGSRAFINAGVQIKRRWYRHVMGRTFHGLVALLSVRGVRDTQCGFKLLDGEVARRLFAELTIERFAYDVELVWLARRHGYRVVEVGVRWADSPSSKVNPVTDSLRMFRDVMALRWRDRGNRNHSRPRD